MQKQIRETGSTSMDPEQYKGFIDFHEKGDLLAPEK
jgi:hypothetical protein